MYCSCLHWNILIQVTLCLYFGSNIIIIIIIVIMYIIYAFGSLSIFMSEYIDLESEIWGLSYKFLKSLL